MADATNPADARRRRLIDQGRALALSLASGHQGGMRRCRHCLAVSELHCDLIAREALQAFILEADRLAGAVAGAAHDAWSCAACGQALPTNLAQTDAGERVAGAAAQTALLAPSEVERQVKGVISDAEGVQL